MIRKTSFLFTLLFSCLLIPLNSTQAQSCSSGSCNDVIWPSTADPASADYIEGTESIWEFCWVTPNVSSGLDGSGVEIKNVKYKGQEVMKWGHTPVLNVDYDSGGCGCYRDWADSESGFASTGVVNTCYAEPSVPVGTSVEAGNPNITTLCEDNGGQGDVGTFTGVALTDYADAVSLTSQMRAGWYRYIMTWVLHADGRIEPTFGFATVNSTCTSAGHRHHVYWRFDMDIDGADNDYVIESSDTAADLVFTTETSRNWGASENQDHVRWTVLDNVTTKGYLLTPGKDDVKLAADGFSKNDFMVSKYSFSELGDNSVGCAINPNDIVQSENVNDEDVVLWYRGGHYHPPGNTADCYGVGPVLSPVGNWGQPNFAKLKIFLKGPFDTGGVMNTDLADDGLIPLSQPYNTLPWSYDGEEAVDVMPAEAVDWVLVQLRSGVTASTIKATVAALLMSDGSLQGIDGSLGADFTGAVAPGDYYVAVFHRNHLPAMTATAIAVGPAEDNYDLTTGQGQAYGSNALIELELGSYGLRGGDGDKNNAVTAFDMLNVWLVENGSVGYSQGDFNLTGDTSAFDFLDIWLLSNGQSSQVPE